jgi:hypothetical protein
VPRGGAVTLSDVISPTLRWSASRARAGASIASLGCGPSTATPSSLTSAGFLRMIARSINRSTSPIGARRPGGKSRLARLERFELPSSSPTNSTAAPSNALRMFALFKLAEQCSPQIHKQGRIVYPIGAHMLCRPSMPKAEKSDRRKASKLTALSKILWPILLTIALIVIGGILLLLVWMIALMIDAPVSD